MLYWTWQIVAMSLTHRGKRPPLIFDVARRRRAGLQSLLKPTHLVVTQLRPGTAGSL